MSEKRLTAVKALEILKNIEGDVSGDEFDEEELDDGDDYDFEIEDESDDDSSTDDGSDVESETEDEELMETNDGSDPNLAFVESPKTSDPSKDKWFEMRQNQYTKIRNRISFNNKSGPTSYAIRRIDSSVLSAFFVIFDQTIIKTIISHTNEEAERNKHSFRLTETELLLFIAVLFCRGVFCPKMSLKLMWSTKYSIPMVRSLCSRNKFSLIMKFLRFDSKSQRKSRVKEDKFTLIRSIWDRFINNSILAYNPDKYLTVDEQLLPCKCRCCFIQYIKSKPDKFGIKFWMLVDVVTKYVCNAIPYLGKNTMKSKSDLQGEYVVKKLIEPFQKRGHCIASDNYFSTIKLARELLTLKTLFIGTIQKNRKELPEIPKLKLHETKFYEDKDGILLTVYQCKKDKSVVLVSTDHEQALVPTTEFNMEKRKPTVVLTYNTKKVGVDSVDQMSRQYSTRAPTRRWPVAVFYNMLNLAVINSWILYKQVNLSKISRQDFIISLIEEILAYSEGEKKTPTTPSTKRRRESNQSPVQPTTPKSARKTCQIRLCNENKAAEICSKCKLFTCGSCTSSKLVTCKNCEK